jgi:SAM-dependent methyltransferase
VVSLGAGGGRKERILLEAMLADGGARYVAVDVSRALVEAALEASADLGVEAAGLCARIEDLARIRKHAWAPVLLCLLGNTFSNFEPDMLLETVAADLAPSDLFLFDCHLGPVGEGGEEGWRQGVERAYGSAENARFNLGPLTARGVPQDACRFSLSVAQVPTPLGPAWRTAKEVHVLRDAYVAFDAGPVRLSAGDVLRMGFTYKHTRPQVLGWVRAGGFEVVEAFADEAETNLLVLVRKARGESDESD